MEIKDFDFYGIVDVLGDIQTLEREFLLSYLEHRELFVLKELSLSLNIALHKVLKEIKSYEEKNKTK